MIDSVQLAGGKAPNKRQLTEQAIALAMQGQWEQAVEINRHLLTFFPNEADALNRLGKALTELRRYGDALATYQQTLVVDPGNVIAQRNVDKLKELVAHAESLSGAVTRGERIDPRLFVEEPGKTVVVPLENRAPVGVLARMNPGDIVSLIPKGSALQVVGAAGEVLGQLESKLGERLISFLAVGNRYVAAVKSVSDGGLFVFIRETYQAPSLAGRPSFTRTASSPHLDFDEEDEELGEGEIEDEEARDEDSEDDDDSLENETESGFTVEENDV
ncbi:MAG: hypothetical protein M1118_02370 [Chloroflexi bacterium]|nr:hypothetical protein [Chloroflexota bacterium]